MTHKTKAIEKWPFLIMAGVIAGVSCGLIATSEGLSLSPPLMFRLLGGIAGGAVIYCLITFRTRGARGRWLCLLALPPMSVIALLTYLSIPTDVAHVTLPDGRLAMLSIDRRVLTDTSYSLWEQKHQGLVWRRTDADLTYSEDGRFVGGERLALASGGNRLIVGRGGIWTDCVEVANSFRQCDLPLDDVAWGDPEFEGAMRRNSATIEAAGVVASEPTSHAASGRYP